MIMSSNKLDVLFQYLIAVGFILSSGAYRVPGFLYPTENGTCYRTVPHTDALLLNVSKGLAEIVSEPAGVKTKSNPGWVRIQECCPGFLKNNETGSCEPQCERDCIGGTCTGPNVCTCNEGLRMERGECKPICRRGCKEHAYCFAPDTCTCEFGYSEVDGVCMPVCLHECMNGDCVAPRDCRCHLGYTLNETKMCEPLCGSGCPHGICESPGVCACSEGYVHPSNTLDGCVPDCPESCEHGKCHSPGVCTCNEGYKESDNGTCIPECPNECSNGECVAPGLCRCDSGFKLDYNSGKCLQSVTSIYPDLTPYYENGKQQNVHIKTNTYENYRSTIPDVIGLNDKKQDHNVYVTSQPSQPYHVVAKEKQEHEIQLHTNTPRVYDEWYVEHGPFQSKSTQKLDNSDEASRESLYQHQDYYQSSKDSIRHKLPKDPCQTSSDISQSDEQQTHEQQITMTQQTPQGQFHITPYGNIHIRKNNNQQEEGVIWTNQGVTVSWDPDDQAPVSVTNRIVKMHKGPLDSSESDEVPQQHQSQNPQIQVTGAQQFEQYHETPHIVNIPSEREPILIDDTQYFQQVHEQQERQREQQRREQIRRRYSTSTEKQEDIFIDSQYTDWQSSMNQHRFNKSRPSGNDRCQCINGECYQGYFSRKCICKEGYKHHQNPDNWHICVPNCSGGCLNGVCTAPDLCICNAGFVKEYGMKDSQKCVAID